MISKKMAAALNEQQNKEIFSAYLYLSMALSSEEMGLKGFANWFNIQVKEELFHAQKTTNYLLDQGAKITLKAIAKPQTEFKSALDLFQATLKHEKIVTKSINDLLSLANRENDHATAAMLQWFISEQVEEEAAATDIIQKLKLIGKDGSGLYMLDKELMARTLPPQNEPQ